MKKMDPGLKAAIEAAGGLRALARMTGVSHVAVFQWKTIPVNHVFTIEKHTRLTREELRPDIFDVPRPRSRRALTAAE